jgi:hypothetical protein
LATDFSTSVLSPRELLGMADGALDSDRPFSLRQFQPQALDSPLEHEQTVGALGQGVDRLS